MRKIQIVLLLLIVLGLLLLATSSVWLPKLTGTIVSYESKEWIDSYFSKDHEHVYYASFDNEGPGTQINISYKELHGADPASFMVVSEPTSERNGDNYVEHAYYADAAHSYTYTITKNASGVSTSVAASQR